MAPLPGWTYILAGAAISGFSKFVEFKAEQKMGLFFFAGIIFMAIGIVKIVIRKIYPPQKKAHQYSHTNPNNLKTQLQQPSKSYKNNMQQIQRSNLQHNNPMQRQTQYNQAQHHIKLAEQNRQTTQEHQSTIPCPACGIRHYNYANFCMICGHKLK